RRTRLHVPHELRWPQGTRDRGESVRGARLLLAGARAPGPCGRAGRTRLRGRVGRLLPEPPGWITPRRLGIAAKRARRQPRRPRRTARGAASAAPRRRDPAPAKLGRIPHGPRTDRVLARTA